MQTLSIRRLLVRTMIGLPVVTLALLLIAFARSDAGALRQVYGVTANDFDTPGSGTAYLTAAQLPPPAPSPLITKGGPTASGNVLRLAFGLPFTMPNQGSLAFDQAAAGAAERLVADFDFRIRPGTGRGDGLGFALLNTAIFGRSGTVAAQTPLVAAEEPNFAASLGIGFDIFRNLEANHTEVNGNHVSVHFDGRRLAEFDVGPAIDLGIGEWIHARVVVRMGNPGEVSVVLAQCGRQASTVVDRLPVPGLSAYAARPYFAGRSGGLTADIEIDNVRIHWMSLEQSVLSFAHGCTTVDETASTATLVVERLGNSAEPVSVHYGTTNASAEAGRDYEAQNGVLTFNRGEVTRTITLPISDDAVDEGDERLLLTLSHPTGEALIGGPAVSAVTVVDDEAARRLGHWSEPFPSQVLAIHAHLLPTGQVMYWDRQDEKNEQTLGLPMTSFVLDGDPRLWDPTRGTITTTAAITYDLFCAGHSFLADGGLFVTGGHLMGTIGLAETSIYHPDTNRWERLPNMNAGRWYPSNVTLANGDVLVVGGTNENGLNTQPQVWEQHTRSWRSLSGATHGGFPAYGDYYPFLYVAPNGLVFNAGPQPLARYLDPWGTGGWRDVATSHAEYREYSSSVMYDEGKVLIVGGTPITSRLQVTTTPPTASAEMIDLGEPTPGWRSAGSMHYARRFVNATLLPDGTVLATGGSSAAGFDNAAGAVYDAELWNPATAQWSLLAKAARYRGYHSTALLLPDGRVLVGGGGHPDPAVGGAQFNFEIYSPPYLFRGARPAITSAPATVAYGQSFLIITPDADRVTQVNWVRLSSVTHSYNQNQRFNRLSFTTTDNGLLATVPADPNLAPPGHYLLFILDAEGVPSVGKITLLDAPHSLPKIQLVSPFSRLASKNP